jgi:hypothetical protein
VKKGKRHTVGKGKKKRKVRGATASLPMAPVRYLMIPLPPRKETP